MQQGKKKTGCFLKYFPGKERLPGYFFNTACLVGLRAFNEI